MRAFAAAGRSGFKVFFTISPGGATSTRRASSGGGAEGAAGGAMRAMDINAPACRSAEHPVAAIRRPQCVPCL